VQSTTGQPQFPPPGEALFPAVLRSNPELDAVVEKLEADHRLVSTYLDEINDSTRDLLREETGEERERVIAALNGLAEHLLTHLAFEEESLGPAIRSWDRLP
jgi:hemerythrin-like domain-containing protein